MIYCGAKAWQLARPKGDRVASLVYPNRADPADFRWPVMDKKVVILGSHEGDAKIQLLVIELLSQGANTVWVCGKPDEDGYAPRKRYERPEL
jgi:hypothetical protein